MGSFNFGIISVHILHLFVSISLLYMLLLVRSIVPYFCILYRGLKNINFWRMYYLLLEDIFAGKDYILSTWNSWQHWKIKLIKSNFSTYRYKLTYRIYIVINIHSKMVSRNLKNNYFIKHIYSKNIIMNMTS